MTTEITPEIKAIVYHSATPKSKLLKAFDLTDKQFNMIKNTKNPDSGHAYYKAFHDLLNKPFWEIQQSYRKMSPRTLEVILSNIPQRYSEFVENEPTPISAFIIRASNLSDEALAWLFHWPKFCINDIRIHKYNYYPQIKPTVAWFNHFTKKEFDDFFDLFHENDADWLCQSLALNFPYQPKYTRTVTHSAKERKVSINPSRITLDEL